MVDQKEQKKTDIMSNLREGNISLILDSYDDLFSDFDPRPFSERALSDDFLMECKRASRDKDDRLELRFLVPKLKRDFKDEIKIKKRLKEHFHRHHLELDKEIKKIKYQGILWFVIGAILMGIGTYLIGIRDSSFFYNLLIIIIEPAGWFFFWEGLNIFFFTTKEKLPDYNFYKKMTKSEIVFFDY